MVWYKVGAADDPLSPPEMHHLDVTPLRSRDSSAYPAWTRGNPNEGSDDTTRIFILVAGGVPSRECFATTLHVASVG